METTDDLDDDFEDFIKLKNDNVLDVLLNERNRKGLVSKVKYLSYLGILGCPERSKNVGESNYSQHVIQPWSIWLDYPELTPFDCDIIKRVLRTKHEAGQTVTESRIQDYKKIIHICEERLRQLGDTE